MIDYLRRVILISLLLIIVLCHTDSFGKNGIIESKSITVCSNGCDYQSIQGAINAAKIGDNIQVYSGKYKENLHINKSIALIGNDNATTIPIIDSSKSPNSTDIIITANNVSIEGFRIINATYGVKVFSDNNTIKSNAICNDHCGIFVYGPIFNYDANPGYTGYFYLGKFVNNNSISLNNINNNSMGIVLQGSRKAELIDNNITSNNRGITLKWSIQNYISNNSICHNDQGIVLNEGSNFNHIISNILNNKKDDIAVIYDTYHNRIVKNIANKIASYSYLDLNPHNESSEWMTVGPTPSHSVLVSSQPSGAEIWLDGTDTNLKTNSSLPFNKAGPHYIELRMKGYNTQRENITIPEAATIDAKLENKTINTP